MSIFKENVSYRPFKYPWAVEAAKRHAIDMFWDVHQVDLQEDLRQYMSADGLKTKNVSHDTHKYILKRLICLFTEMDRTVAAGYKKLLPYIKNNEISNLFLTQGAREVTHQRAYALAAETFGFTDVDWAEFAEYAEMREKLEVMSSDLTKPEYRDELNAMILLAQILLGEGIGLYGPFTTLLNMKRHGILIGFNDINQWSLVDENDHVLNNIHALKEGREDLTEEENKILDDAIRKMVAWYVSAEHKYIDLLSLHGEQEDMSMEAQKGYIDYLGELRLKQLGLRQRVRKNPLPWMDWMLSAGKHDNFFEKRVTDYSHARLPGTINYAKYASLLPENRSKVVDSPS